MSHEIEIARHKLMLELRADERAQLVRRGAIGRLQLARHDDRTAEIANQRDQLVALSRGLHPAADALGIVTIALWRSYVGGQRGPMLGLAEFQPGKGWKFLPYANGRRVSTKFHPTFEACLPRWTGGLDGTESAYVRMRFGKWRELRVVADAPVIEG